MTSTSANRNLVRAGILAGPLYLVIGYAQAFLRDGFDLRRHALSVLSNGEFGWIQTTNFLLSGALVIAGAVGLRRALSGVRAGTWGPILMATYGVGLLGAGIFPADPAMGFPPGATESAALSQSGLLHFVFGGLGFYALIAACFVFARRFRERGETSWVVYSILSGVFFFGSFAAIASGSISAMTMLVFYGAVTWIWIWHSVIHTKVLREGMSPPWVP
jgi:hypothetical protein